MAVAVNVGKSPGWERKEKYVNVENKGNSEYFPRNIWDDQLCL